MSQIKLKQFYRGRLTKEALIAPGTYDSADPALFGLAAYLVNLGVGEWVKERPAAPSSEIDIDAFMRPEPGVTPPSIPAEPQLPPNDDLPADEVVIVRNPQNYADMEMELLRGEIARRGLDNRIVATGKNGNALKADLVKVLQDADSE